MHHIQVENFIKLVRDSFEDSVKVYTEGSCFKFCLILIEVFSQGRIYYDGDHAITKIDGRYYDITGEVEKSEHHVDLLENYGIVMIYGLLNLKYDK